MRRGRLFLLVALLLIVVLVAVYILMGGLTTSPTPDVADLSQMPTPTPIPQTIDVVVVTQRVNRGTDFTEAILGFVEIPLSLQIPGSYTDLSEVLGRRAKFDLDSGVILTANMTTESAEQFSTAGSDWALLIPPGRVAVSIPISRLTSVSYGPRKGDHVNVIVTMLIVDVDAAYQSILPNNTASVIAPGYLGEPGLSPLVLSLQVAESEAGAAEGRIQPETTSSGADDEDLQFYYIVPSESQRPRMVSQTLIQDAIVLQVGDFPLEDERPAPTATPEPGAEQGGLTPTGEQTPVATQAPPPPPDLITLIVSPQDAVTLNHLIYSGAQLTLALRAANDTSLVQTEAVTLQYLLDVYNIPVPVKLPYSIQPRVDRLEQPKLPNDAAPTSTPQP
jgi:Flp pilus assembly protein CpaB